MSERKELDNRLVIGGVFLNFHEKIQALTSKLDTTTELLEMANEELNCLYIENENTKVQWKRMEALLRLRTNESRTASSCVDELQSRTEDLENRALYFKDKCTFLESERVELETSRSNAFMKCEDYEKQIVQLERIIAVEKLENTELRDLLYARDLEIDSLNKDLKHNEEDFEKLKKSLSTKDKQLLSVCKDRDRVKDALSLARKALLPKQREQIDSEGSGKSSPLSDTTKENRPRSTMSTQKKKNTNTTLDNFDVYLSGDKMITDPFNSKDRQYETTIRKLKLELQAVRSAGTISSIKGKS